MPKSKGRKVKHGKGSPRRPGGGRAGYRPGRIGLDPALIAKLLASGPPDQVVEMLPPLLWLHHSRGFPANLCVSAALTLRFAFEWIGVRARPTPVDLVISDQGTGRRARYGEGEPRWDGEHFSGHCVLWLPGSRRWIDTTVMQYPEVRGSAYPLPVVGRMADSWGGSAVDHAELAAGRLTAGTRMTVPRGELVLEYTVCADPDDIVMTALSLTPGMEARLRNTGINLIAGAVDWWRKPGVVARVRDAPYPRLHALLDLVGDAPMIVDESNGDCSFEVAPARLVRVDELLRTQ
ncbi:hypothetical protein [Nocardia sp. IFM 10818]